MITSEPEELLPSISRRREGLARRFQITVPRRRFGFRQFNPSQLLGQIRPRANLLIVRHQPGYRGAILEQHESDVLIMGAVDAIGKIARSFRDADELPHKIRLSDFSQRPNHLLSKHDGLASSLLHYPPVPSF